MSTNIQMLPISYPLHDELDELNNLEEAKANIERRIEELKAIILPTIQMLKTHSHNGYIYSVQKKLSYHYSGETIEMDVVLKARKKYERDTNLAQVIDETLFLTKRKDGSKYAIN